MHNAITAHAFVFHILQCLDMTTVIIRKTADGVYKGFTCMGHAGFAGRGRDIVCASVSVLVINTINSMEKLAGEEPEVATDEETGFIQCRFLHPLSHEGALFMDSMVLGLSGIAEEYGRKRGKKYLVLNFEEV